MADYTLLDVGYGFFGAPSYDENEHTWAFGRNPGRQHVLNFLGGFEILSTASASASPTAAYLQHHNRTDQRARKTHAKQVFDSFPDLRGSLRLAEPSLLASQIVSRAQQSYDPSQGDRLAVGMLKHPGQEYCPLFALPGGRSGESLQLVKTELVAHSFGQRVNPILVPWPIKDVSWWVGRGAPLRQICFASTCGGEKISRFLAIRTPLTTWFFRFLSRSTLVPPAGHATDTSYPFSSIEIEPLLEIPFPAQCEHADVAFNPEYDRQFAVIDQVGGWSVSDLKPGRTFERLKSLLPTASGVMTRSDDGKESQHQLHGPNYLEDGWARIRWAGDVNTLVLCTRKLLEFVDLKGRPMSAPDLTLGLAPRDEKPWHLDVRVCSGPRNQLFILTTTKIFWLRVLSADSVLPANETPGGRVLLSVRHFRDPRDLTMQIKVLEHDSGILVALHSRASPIITCYRFGFSDDYKDMPILLSDPSDLTVPALGNSPMSVIDDIHIRRLGSVKNAGQHLTVFDPSGTHVYELLVLLDDLSLLRSLLYSQDNQSAKNVHSAVRLSKNPTKLLQGVDDRFVIPNGEPDNGFPGADGMTLRHECMDRFATAKLQAREASAPRRTFDMRPVYGQLISGFDEDDKLVPAEPISILEGVQKLVKERSEYTHPTASLLELRDLSLSLFSADQLVRGLLHVDEATRRAGIDNLSFLIEQLPSSSLITGMKNIADNSSLSVIHKRLVSKMSGFRLSGTSASFLDLRQKTSFLIAAEICLSVAVVPVPTAEPRLSQTNDESRATSQSFPRGLVLRISQTDSQSSPSSRPLIETQASSHDTQPASVLGIKVGSRDSILMRYVRFKKPTPGPRNSTARTLKHWKLGDNPLDYHYTVITRNLDLDLETSQMTNEERQKAAAKRQRLEQRRAKESARFMQSSQTTQNQIIPGYNLSSGRNQALPTRPSQSLLKTALERNVAGSQIPLSSQASVGGSQASRKKRKKGF